MESIWSFLLQTLSVSVAAAVLLLLKYLLQDKLSPRWQYGIWGVLALRILLPAGTARQVLLPLSRQNTDAILRRELGDEIADRLGDWLYQESGGNLRLLSDLVQTYERTGDVRSAIESLNEYLLNRLRGLSQDALQVTHLLCLSSGGVSVQALQELMGMDTRRLSCLSDSSPLICAVAYAFAGSSFLIGLVRRDTL